MVKNYSERIIEKICLWKLFFEKGYGLTHYLFKLGAVVGIAAQDWRNTLIFGFIYAVFCFILGRFWYKTDFMRWEIEIVNRVNPFVKEVRNFVKKPKSK